MRAIVIPSRFVEGTESAEVATSDENSICTGNVNYIYVYINLYNNIEYNMIIGVT
jgi:hypothetical protein